MNNTLWNILEQYGIEIPPIQRDYAQGRETEHANKVRKSFLDAICKALETNKPLSLDFVYGKIHGLKNEEEHRKNKQAIQSLVNSIKDYALTVDLRLKDVEIEDKFSKKSDLEYLIPLDGQQRLTTLFLIHWYIAKRLKNEESLAVLSRFRYKTRKSSSSFLKLLIDKEVSLNFDIAEDKEERNLKKKKLYVQITNLEHFSSSWLNDPTVRAMLLMIQDIHIRLQSHTNEQLNNYWISLTEKQLLWFDFLNLKDFNLSDELYVKMNARGKQLSSFENFKAWLFDLIKEKKLIENTLWESYSNSFDVEWNDIFWNQKDEDVYSIDNAYFNFFKILFLYDNTKIAELDGTNFDIATKEFEIINVILNNSYFDWEYLCSAVFENNIKNYLQVLSYCEGFHIRDNDDKYLKTFFKFQYSVKDSKPSWTNLIKNFITLSFISVKAKPLKVYSDEDFIHLKEYHRILFNLFDNTNIENPRLYQNAIEEIEELNTKLRNFDYSITNWVENFEYTTKSVFTEKQILEEILKYRLFPDDEWKTIILEAEQITYFERQLNFWFYRAHISLAKDKFDSSLLNNSKSKENFRSTTLKINKLFEEKEINRKGDFSERIFERALLSKSDYLLKERGYWCFGRDLGRDVSWKRLFFRDRNSANTNVALLEVFELNFLDVKNSFQSYIDENIAKYEIENWRLAFVTNKELFNYLGDLKYIREISNHGWVIIMGSYKTHIGAHYELFSLDFYIKHLRGKSFPPFNNVDYHTAPKNTKEEVPCAFLDWETDKFIYAFDVKFISGEYHLVFFAKQGILSDEIRIILIGLGFNVAFDSYIKSVILEEDVKQEIHRLVNTLGKLTKDIADELE
ncbi:DUF262 domain-containing protein [uncultured Kordia sp.]|uniref:GmrSD restriction endonuclease domain-containing protein n=1 Tax=uncultured Kordia sp. TaxID=507699 RepID=UPI00261D32A7|nr:DUF262 domain-containing protein [uncultured Kordia sp.]